MFTWWQQRIIHLLLNSCNNDVFSWIHFRIWSKSDSRKLFHSFFFNRSSRRHQLFQMLHSCSGLPPHFIFNFQISKDDIFNAAFIKNKLLQFLIITICNDKFKYINKEIRYHFLKIIIFANIFWNSFHHWNECVNFWICYFGIVTSQYICIFKEWDKLFPINYCNLVFFLLRAFFRYEWDWKWL